MEKLAIVMPVYNEEEAIGAVLDKWVKAMDQLGIAYAIHPYNDGSKDGSLKVIEAKATEYPGKVIAHTKSNSGHGPTILQGYREAAAAGYDWVFQIDSDDEMGPEGFAELWNQRENHDFLVGIRDGRKQALPRKIISAVSRLSVRLFYGKSVWDVNTPYRLMRVSAFREVWNKIPSDTFAPNVIISGMAARLKLRLFETRVPQKDRQTGEVSIKKWKLMKAAAKSFWQTISFSLNNVFLLLPICFFLSAFLFSMSIYMCPFAKTGTPYPDSCVFWSIGRWLRSGIVPYRDVFDHKGPMIYFLTALGDWIGGFRGIGALEIVFWCLFLFCLYKTWILLRADILNYCLVILFLPLVIRDLLVGGNMVAEYAIPCIAYGNLFLVDLCVNKKIRYTNCFLLGICAAFVLCLKPNMALVFSADIIALLFYFCIYEKKWSRFFYTVASGLGGVAFVLLPVLLFFGVHNAIPDMIRCVFEFNIVR